MNDPKEIFRLAASFEYSGRILASAVKVTLEYLARSCQLPFEMPPGTPESQTPGGILIPATDPPPVVTVSIPKDKLSQVPTVAPWIVIQAFATELFIKCLHAVDGREVRGHSLVALFGNLSDERKNRINAIYDEIAKSDEAFAEMQRAEPTDKLTLAFSLQEMDRAFEIWRYAYESPGPVNCFLGEPWKAVKRTILELKPEWQIVVDNLGSPPTFQSR
jgi:hypothetical protein